MRQAIEASGSSDGLPSDDRGRHDMTGRRLRGIERSTMLLTPFEFGPIPTQCELSNLARWVRWRCGRKERLDSDVEPEANRSFLIHAVGEQHRAATRDGGREGRLVRRRSEEEEVEEEEEEAARARGRRPS